MVGVSEDSNNFDEEFTFNSPPDDENSEDLDENEENNDDECENGDEFLSEPELKTLNDQIDQLNSCLDAMEKQNDDLKSELLELLESNRQARKEFAEERDRMEKVANLDINDHQTPDKQS